MKFLRTVWAELIGLFVDDWAFALLTLLWVGLFATPLRALLGAWAGPAFFAGPAALILAFTVRRAGR